jgi:hypothetical protein
MCGLSYIRAAPGRGCVTFVLIRGAGRSSCAFIEVHAWIPFAQGIRRPVFGSTYSQCGCWSLRAYAVLSTQQESHRTMIQPLAFATRILERMDLVGATNTGDGPYSAFVVGMLPSSGPRYLLNIASDKAAM